ncbi:MAG TPA: hypothetical protein VHG72_14110 [Polyangia bacterium]|nr:hypothetical protein [Polyangia bacterium]
MRERTKRRARQRLDAKEIRDVWRMLADRGIAARVRAVNQAVAPGSPVFWHVFKLRLAAREELTPIRTAEEVRDVAADVLAEEGIDLAGVVLKVTWQPTGDGRGQLFFEAGAEHGAAVDAVTDVRASDRGRERDAARRALAPKV